MTRQNSDALEFTVTSSAEELRYAARAGDLAVAERVISRYVGESNPLSKLLRAVLAATDDLSGNTSLHLCCANGHMDLVQLLLRHNAPVDATNLSGSTPLHYASLTGQLDVVRTLVSNGVKPVVENKYGRTALDEAYSGRHEDVAKFLLEHVEATGSAPDLDEGSANSDEKQDANRDAP